jgi:hypothetical protein
LGALPLVLVSATSVQVVAVSVVVVLIAFQSAQVELSQGFVSLDHGHLTPLKLPRQQS